MASKFPLNRLPLPVIPTLVESDSFADSRRGLADGKSELPRRSRYFRANSMPAVFLIKTDPFILHTSNIFAIMGLRALFFTLAASVINRH